MAKIIEINSINHVLSHVDVLTDVVFFDIDNTILDAVGRPGPAQWANGIENHIRNIYAPRLGLDTKNQDVLIKHHISQYTIAMQAQLIELDAVSVISALQQQQKIVLALTARPLATAAHSTKQLESVGINLSIHSLDLKQAFFETLAQPAAFQDGILTCNGMGTKGAAACHLFSVANITPRRVILVDDSLDFVKEVGDYMDRANIDFIGLRYGYLDEKIKNFIFTDDLLPDDLR